jgi:hypothetical protein
MKRISSILFVICFLALTLAFLAGCRARECQQMLRCCEVVKDHEGIGGACGELAQGVKDPNTCRTILRTIDVVFEERDEELPQACK